MIERKSLELPDWLLVAARSAPCQPALELGGERWTYADMARAVEAAGGMLASAAGAEGGRIGILAANRPGYVVAVHAARWLGRVIVPLNWRQTDEELVWQVRDAGISVLIVDEEQAPRAATIAGDSGITVVAIEELEHSEDTASFRLPEPRIDLGREAAVLYTSGTSGRPKGARLTYGNFWYSAVGSALHLGHHRGDIWAASMPLFHIGGLSILMRAVIGAIPVVLHERFDAGRLLDAIDSGVTLVSVVPAMLRQLLEGRGEAPWPVSLRTVLLGGSAAPVDLVQESLRRGIPVAPTYGLTESASQATTLLPSEVALHLGSSGRPLPLTEVRITGQNGLAAPGETGEIEIRGPTVFAGYLDRDPSPTESDEPLRRSDINDGWFRTGDAGYLDDEGYLYVVDRRDDLIVSGGENVYPAEIERVLLTHPAVRDAAVIGLPDATWGARPVAVVVWDGDPAAAETELRVHCRARLAGFKVPNRFDVCAELPRSPSGKLLRRRLRAALLGEEGE